jgi:hypothetical protein
MSRSFWVPKMLAAILSIKIEFLCSLFYSSLFSVLLSRPTYAWGGPKAHVQSVEVSIFQSYSPERRLVLGFGLEPLRGPETQT